MKECRTLEFFEGIDQRLSMATLLKFLAFWPATYIAGKIGTVEALLVYLGAYVADSGVSKIADALKNRQRSPTVNAAGPSTVNITAKGKK